MYQEEVKSAIILLYLGILAGMDVRKRQISLAQANEIAEHAILAISQRNGTQHAYYSEKGFIVIRQDGSIGTVGWLDDAGKQIVEVMKQHGF